MGIKEKIENLFKSETTEEMPKIDPGLKKITAQNEANRFENSDEKLVIVPEDKKPEDQKEVTTPSNEHADQDIIASD
jgi:hypothetical protein